MGSEGQFQMTSPCFEISVSSECVNVRKLILLVLKCHTHLNPSKETIDLCENDVAGTILPYLDRMHSLESIKLDRNKFVGTLPITLGDLSSLQRLSLGSNNFHGSLPSDWSRLTSLTTLQVEDNPSLWGTVPSTYSSLTSLGKLKTVVECTIIVRRRNQQITPHVPPLRRGLLDLRDKRGWIVPSGCL